MSMHETLFMAGNIVILPFWGLMILAPRWHVSQKVMGMWWPVVIVAALYIVAILSSVLTNEVDLSKLTFDLIGIAYLLGSPIGATTAWLHLLAFDLFAGRWAYLDSRERKLPIWMASPALLYSSL